MIHLKKEHMLAAIEEARRARVNGDYGIGAVIVLDEKIVASEPNVAMVKRDPTRHAEIEVIRSALVNLNRSNLQNCILYTTHEPCPMCATAAVWARVAGVVYGARMTDIASYSLENRSEKWSWRTVSIP